MNRLRSRISALFTNPVEYRFPGVPGKTMMFKQMRLNPPELTAIHMDQFPADLTNAMEVSGALLIFRVSITRAFTRAENILPYTSILNKLFQLPVNRRCTNGFVLGSKVILNLRGSKMPSGCSLQEVQELFPGSCPIGRSLSHKTLLPNKFENRSQLYTYDVRMSIIRMMAALMQPKPDRSGIIKPDRANA